MAETLFSGLEDTRAVLGQHRKVSLDDIEFEFAVRARLQTEVAKILCLGWQKQQVALALTEIAIQLNTDAGL